MLATEFKKDHMQTDNLIDEYMEEKGFTGDDFVKLFMDDDGEAFKRHHKNVMDAILQFLINSENPLAAIDKIRNDAVTQATGTVWLSCRIPCTHWKWMWTSQGDIAVIFHKVNIGRDSIEYLEFSDEFIEAFAENLTRFCTKTHLPGYVIITDGILRKAGM
nr:hypothetical protein [uncultured Blautia sp.]